MLTKEWLVRQLVRRLLTSLLLFMAVYCAIVCSGVTLAGVARLYVAWELNRVMNNIGGK